MVSNVCDYTHVGDELYVKVSLKCGLNNAHNDSRAQTAAFAALAHPAKDAVALGGHGNGEVLFRPEGGRLPSPGLGNGKAVRSRREANQRRAECRGAGN